MRIDWEDKTVWQREREEMQRQVRIDWEDKVVWQREREEMQRQVSRPQEEVLDKAVWQREREEMQLQLNRLREEVLDKAVWQLEREAMQRQVSRLQEEALAKGQEEALAKRKRQEEALNRLQEEALAAESAQLGVQCVVAAQKPAGGGKKDWHSKVAAKIKKRPTGPGIPLPRTRINSQVCFGSEGFEHIHGSGAGIPLSRTKFISEQEARSSTEVVSKLSDGRYVHFLPSEADFDKAIGAGDSKVHVPADGSIPKELQCALAEGSLIMDAVILPCCQTNVSLQAVLTRLHDNSLCPICMQPDVFPEMLQENKKLRESAKAFMSRSTHHREAGRALAARASVIHFKFRNNLAEDMVAFEGDRVSLADLKRLIAKKKGLLEAHDIEFVISNMDTQEEYTDAAMFILKDTRVMVRKINVKAQSLQLKDVPERAAMMAVAAVQKPMNKDLRASKDERKCSDCCKWFLSSHAKHDRCDECSKIFLSRKRAQMRDRQVTMTPAALEVPHAKQQQIMGCRAGGAGGGQNAFGWNPSEHIHGSGAGIPLSRTKFISEQEARSSTEVVSKLSDGRYVHFLPSEADFDKAIGAGDSKVHVPADGSIPKELQCALAEGSLIMDAVILPCCQTNVSLQAVLTRLHDNSLCPICMQPDVFPEMLQENKKLRESAKAYMCIQKQATAAAEARKKAEEGAVVMAQKQAAAAAEVRKKADEEAAAAKAKAMTLKGTGDHVHVQVAIVDEGSNNDDTKEEGEVDDSGSDNDSAPPLDDGMAGIAGIDGRIMGRGGGHMGGPPGGMGMRPACTYGRGVGSLANFGGRNQEALVWPAGTYGRGVGSLANFGGRNQEALVWPAGTYGRGVGSLANPGVNLPPAFQNTMPFSAFCVSTYPQPSRTLSRYLSKKPANSTKSQNKWQRQKTKSPVQNRRPDKRQRAVETEQEIES